MVAIGTSWLKRPGDEIETVYEGHSRSEVYRELLSDLGITIPETEERDMSEGSFDPSEEDW